MPPALPNLYTLPADVFDLIGTEGVQLRLDDHNLATGQNVLVTANAAVAATVLSITALSVPVLAGTVLEFDGGNMQQTVEAVVTVTGKTGDTALTVSPLLFAMNAGAAARDSGVNYALAQRLVKACKYATAQVKLYCSPRYQDSDLVNSWSVNRWATTLAARWVCRRRAQGAPKAIEADAAEVLEELKGVRFGYLNIEDIGTREPGWPFLSNVTVDVSYDVAKIRVEAPLSEPSPVQYGQFVDWNSLLLIETW